MTRHHLIGFLVILGSFSLLSGQDVEGAKCPSGYTVKKGKVCYKFKSPICKPGFKMDKPRNGWDKCFKVSNATVTKRPKCPRGDTFKYYKDPNQSILAGTPNPTRKKDICRAEKTVN